MTTLDLCDVRLKSVIAAQPHPLLFVTVSGAHLYGFASPDSDVDLRGAHCLPLDRVVGLDVSDETLEWTGVRDGIEIDLVSHDVCKFIKMMLKRNGYVLEQLQSPLVLHTTPLHVELKALAPLCLTKHHAFHYLGFAETQWGLFRKENPPRVKPLLYTYRVLLTGIHLMRTGRVEANLQNLNEMERLSHIDDLLQLKRTGAEKQTVTGPDIAFHECEYRRLVATLEPERDRSALPENPGAYSALNDLLLRIRLSARGSPAS